MLNEHEHQDSHRDRKSDERGGQEVTIIVNGRENSVEKGELAFDQLVALAFDSAV